jgi:hypothetical protein
VEAVVIKALESMPASSTHWSVRTMAHEGGVAPTTAFRIWQAFGLQPHRQETFKLSADPMFGDGARHRRSVHEPAADGDGLVRRREEPISGRSIARSRYCHWPRAFQNGEPTTMSAMTPRRGPPRWTRQPAPPSAKCTAATAARSRHPGSIMSSDGSPRRLSAAFDAACIAQRATRDLEPSIKKYLTIHNADPRSFMWTKSADDILASIDRLCLRISGPRH